MGQITYANKVALNENPSIPDINKVTDDDMNEIKNVVNQNETKILIAVSDTAPAQCTTGDLYYNTTSKKIFVATDTNTWSSTGSNPTSNTIYILFDTKTTYSYDGTDLVSVGGGGAEVSIDTTQPTDDEKIWINPNETTNQAKFKDGNTWKELTIKALDGMPIGCIILFAGNTIPTGWLKCEGQSLLRTEYSELFGAINTIYGNVDSTHFNIPDYEGKVPVGLDSSDTDFDTLGETRGEKTHTLTIQEMPSHSHSLSYGGPNATGGTWNLQDHEQSAYSGSNYFRDGAYMQSTGGGQAHNNIQPSIVAYYIIKAKNTTPTMASIVDDYSTSTTDGYSANYVNAIKTELRNLMKFSDWTNLYTSGNNYVKYRYNAFMCEVSVFLESTHTSDFTAGTLPSACRPSNRTDQELTGVGLNYGRIETSGNVILHNENGYATTTFTFTLTN